MPETPEQAQSLEAEPESTEVKGTDDLQSDAPNQETAEAVSTETKDEVPVVEAAPEPTQEIAKEEPVKIEYSSFDDVKMDALSNDVRAHVEPIMKLVAAERATIEVEKQNYERSRKEFVDLIDAMESSGYDVKPLQTRIDEQNEFISTMSNDIIDTAWQAFSTTHPEFSSLPENARELFATELESLFERHSGATVLDRMNNAYDYALWRSGIDKNTIGKEKAVQPAPTKSVQSNQNARKQAAIADGKIATSAPVRSVDELDWDEVLNRHAHLLDR